MRVLFTLFLAIVASLTHAAGYPPVTVEVRAIQVGPHSYYIKGHSGAASQENEGFMSNAGFVVTPAGVVVFDSLGSPSLAEAMLAEIRRVTAAPIRRVIVSHYHADHYYGLQVFKDQGAEIWAHEGARGMTATEAATQRLHQRSQSLLPWITPASQRLIEADVWLEGDTAFTLGGIHLEIRALGPAHSAEDIALYVVEDQVLYAGDVAFLGRIPYIGDANTRLWLKGLEKLLALHPRILIPGHGEASTRPVQDLQVTLAYIRHLRREMGKAAHAMTPFEEAYAQTDWSQYADLPAFDAANYGNARGVYIQMETEPIGQE